MAIYLSSDWHLIKNEGGITYVRPDFDEIIESQTSQVTDDDTFIFMGDMFDDDVVKKASEYYDILGASRFEALRNLKGKKIFIRGNNDIQSDEFYMNVLKFNSVKFSFVLDKSRVIISHTSLPIHTRTGWVNIHGHIHKDGVDVDAIPYYHNAESCINICNRGRMTFAYDDINIREELNRNNKTCTGFEKPMSAFIQNQAMSYFRKALAANEKKYEKQL